MLPKLYSLYGKTIYVSYIKLPNITHITKHSHIKILNTSNTKRKEFG